MKRLEAACKCRKAQTASLAETDPCRLHQTESDSCDASGSIYKEKVHSAECCLGRGRINGQSPMETDSWLQLNLDSTATALLDADPLSFSHCLEVKSLPKQQSQHLLLMQSRYCQISKCSIFCHLWLSFKGQMTP